MPEDRAAIGAARQGHWEIYLTSLSPLPRPWPGDVVSRSVLEINVVWRECRRVLRQGGRLLAGFMNPDFYLLDHDAVEQGGALEVRYALPFSPASLPPRVHDRRLDQQEAFGHSHSLDDQIGSQVVAGFAIRGFCEDRWNEAATRLNPCMPTTFATLASREPWFLADTVKSCGRMASFRID